MSYEAIAIFMFISMMLMLLTGQRVFAAIGVVAALASLLLWGDSAVEMPFNAAFKLFNWYPLLTLPLFIYMGYILSESGIADDLYAMNDFDPAIAAATSLIERYPASDPDLRRAAWTVIAHSSFELEAYADAERAYTRVLQFVPEDDEERPSLIDNLAARGQPCWISRTRCIRKSATVAAAPRSTAGVFL